MAYAIHLQRHRRNLTDAEILRCIEALDKRMSWGGDRNSLKFQEKIKASSEALKNTAQETAKVVGISRAKVERARTVLKHAEEPVKEAVKAGALSINQAYQLTQEKRQLEEIGKPVFNRINDRIEWVPQEWIDAVLKAVRQAPQWTFLFLTKNPRRYLEIDFPANAWVGATADTQNIADEALEVFCALHYGLAKVQRPSILFLSMEPLREKIDLSGEVHMPQGPVARLSALDWLIIGGQSQSSEEPAQQPAWALACHNSSCFVPSSLSCPSCHSLVQEANARHQRRLFSWSQSFSQSGK